jgi:hypothetical protein
LTFEHKQVAQFWKSQGILKFWKSQGFWKIFLEKVYYRVSSSGKIKECLEKILEDVTVTSFGHLLDRPESVWKRPGKVRVQEHII